LPEDTEAIIVKAKEIVEAAEHEWRKPEADRIGGTGRVALAIAKAAVVIIVWKCCCRLEVLLLFGSVVVEPLKGSWTLINAQVLTLLLKL
jgi:hypothetical protein